MLEGEMYIAEDEEQYVVRANDLLFLRRRSYPLRLPDQRRPRQLLLGSL